MRSIVTDFDLAALVCLVLMNVPSPALKRAVEQTAEELSTDAHELTNSIAAALDRFSASARSDLLN